MTDYRPIECGLHSEYELLAMHRERVRLSALTEEGESLSLQGRVVDLLTDAVGEYLVLEEEMGQRQRIRLDRLRSVSRI